MNILIDIGHPGHVHFFKNFIWEMEKKGHKIIVTARKKDVIEDLLNHYKIDFIFRGEIKKSTINKAINMPKISLKLAGLIKKNKIEYSMGILNPYVSQSASLTGQKSFIFSDTEHAKLANRITIPFCNQVLTPSCFNGNLGSKHIRYKGYHELAYLHPNRFNPDSSVLDGLQMNKEDRFVIIRFVSWGASHDIGQKGISDENKIRLVEGIKKHAIPLITSEGKIPNKLQKYKIKIPPHMIHDAMFYSNMYIGEGATMASEAAVMGTPSIFIHPMAGIFGTTKEQSERYNLLMNMRHFNLAELEDIIKKNINKKSEWKRRKKKMLKERIDVTSFIIWFVENYPESEKTMKVNNDNQLKFLN
ncbi:MAG: DUF354 domain-containing protein [Candidatus Thorarchaeota archaeon]